MLSGYIFLVLLLGEIPILLPSFLRLRIIEARPVTELADFLRTEKIETESHIFLLL